MGVREFTGELDSVPVVKEFTGTLDGETPGVIDRIKGAWNAGRDIKPLANPDGSPMDTSDVFNAGMPNDRPAVFADPAVAAGAERALGFEPTQPVQEIGFAEAGRRSMANEATAARTKERAALPSIQPTPYTGLSVRDPALALKTGSADIGQAVGKGLRYAGAEQAGQLLQDAGTRVSKESQRAMSPSGQIAMEGQIFDDDLTAGETPLASASLQALRSLPAMIAMLPAGAGVSKGITAAGGKTLELLATRPGWIGFLSRTMPSAVGAGVAEGSIAALQNAAHTETQILESPLGEIRKSPYYAKLLAETNPNQPLPQRERQVRKAIAGIASDEVARRTFVSTGGLGALLGGGAQGMVLRRLAGQGGGDSIVKALVKGAGQEAIQEAPQSAGEQYIQNLATQNYVDPSIDASRGVVGAGASGAAVGGLTGGVMGGGARVLSGPKQSQDDQPAPYIRPPSQEAEYQAAARKVFSTPAELRDEQLSKANAAAGADLRASLSGQPQPAAAPVAPTPEPVAAAAPPPVAPGPAPGSLLHTQGLADPNAPAGPTVAAMEDGSAIAGHVIGETPEGDIEFLGDDGVSYRFGPGEATFGDVPAPSATPAPAAIAPPQVAAPTVSEFPEGAPLDGEIPAVQADAEVVAPRAEAASRELPGSGSVLAPVAAGLPAGTGDRAEVAASSVRPAAPVRAARAESVAQPVDNPPVSPVQKQPEAAPIKAPAMVDVQAADGRTVRVLQSELAGPRALLRVHDAAGNPMQNQDGNALLVKREQLTPAASQKPEATPAQPPAAVKESLTVQSPPSLPVESANFRTKRPSAPKSLLTFLKSKGGLHTSEAEDFGGDTVKALNKRFPTLFRKAGLSADAAREVLQQHGWLDNIDETDQLNATRELISKALRGDKSVVKDAVALMEAEADARAAAYYAEHGGHPSHDADSMNMAVESLADLHLDAAIDAAWNNTEGSMSNEDLAAWLGEDQTEARAEGVAGPAAGAAESSAIESRGEAAQGFDLAGQTPAQVEAQERQRQRDEADTEKAKKAADEAERKTEEAKEVKRRNETAAANFNLGESALDNLNGQGDIFSAPPALQKSEGNATPVQSTPASKIEDLGEKIGGARKDTSNPIGSRQKSTAETQEAEPGWRKRFVAVKNLVAGEAEEWNLFDAKTNKPIRQGYTIAKFPSEEAADKAVPLIAVAQKHRVVLGSRNGEPESYEIWRDVTDRKRVKVIDQTFPTRDDAMRYMSEHAVEIIETKTSFGEEILAKPEKVMRSGEPRRTGPVRGDDFMQAFGFRSVEFGNWNNQDERQEVMNHAYDGLLDLAEVLGVPPKALSLNGDLSLAFGARGQGLSGARAHYERNYAAMNLTKMQGAGALAHEWFHAADHYFGRQDGKAKSEKVTNSRGDAVFDSNGPSGDYASHGFQWSKSGVREDVRKSYETLIKSLFRKAETYVEDTQAAEKFVGGSRDALRNGLDKLRADLAEQKDPSYYKTKNKPASAEQLAEFDRLAARFVEGEDLATEYRANHPDKPARARGVGGGRLSNDALEAMSAIYKAVRGRSGFTAERAGVLDQLRGMMARYAERIKMLNDARGETEKTKQVPTSYAMNAKRIDQGRASDYWTTEHEMAARAFSAYVEDKIAAREHRSDFLSFGSNNNRPEYRMLNVRPFPEGAERVAINAAFDRFFQTVETKESDDGNVAMFSRAYHGSPHDHDRLLLPSDRVGNSSEVERLPDGLISDAKGLADFANTEAFIQKGFGGFNIPSQLAQLRRVVRLIENVQIRRAVISSVPVDVMDVLAGQQLTPEKLFDDVSVFGDLFSINGNNPVSLPVDVASRLANVVAAAATKVAKLPPLDGARAPLESDTAVIANKRDSLSPALDGTVNQLSVGSPLVDNPKVGSANATGNGFHGFNPSKGNESVIPENERIANSGIFSDADIEIESKHSRGRSSVGQSTAAVRAEVAAKIGKSRLGQLERKGLVKIHDTMADMPEAAQKHPDTWGYFDGKTIHLVAENLSKGQAAPVFQHEAWHAVLRSLKLDQSPLYQKIMDRLAKLEKNNAQLSPWFKKAAAMIPAEDRGNDARRLNELAAYAIQQYESDLKSLPMTLRNFVQDLIASVRAFFMEKLGWVPANLTAADLSALTSRYVKAMATGEPAAGVMGEAMASRESDPRSSAFKRWFGSSVITDNGKLMSEGGKPLVVYHGRSAGLYVPDENMKAAQALRAEGHVIAAKLREKYGKDENGAYRTDLYAGDPLNDQANALYEKANAIQGEYHFKDPDIEGENFDVKRSGDVGIHFTPSAKTASRFGKEGAVFPVYLKAGRVIRVPDVFSRYQGLTTALHELVKSGAVSESKIEALRDSAAQLDSKNYEDERDWGSDRGVVSFWKKLNGIMAKQKDLALIYHNEVEGGGDSIVVFDPTQIKSATGNIGTFDPANPDIRYSRNPKAAAFEDPSQLANREHEARADQYKLTAEQRTAFRPKVPADKVTGFFRAEEHEPTILRAKAYAETNNIQAFYVEADVSNLGGINDHFKNNHGEANKPFRAMTDIFREELEQAGAKVVPVRHGGDEVSAVLMGSSEAAIRSAFAKIESRIQAYANAQGLSQIKHPKGKKPGIGLYFGHSPINGEKIGTIVGEASEAIDAQKNAYQEAQNVGRTQAAVSEGIPGREDGRGEGSGGTQSSAAVPRLDSAGDRNDGEEHFSRPAAIGKGVKGDHFTLPAESVAQKGQRLIQDSANRWTIVQDAIKEQGGVIDDSTNVAEALQRYPGKLGAAFEQFNHGTIEPLLERMAQAKTTMEQIGTYLYALHAPERNAEMAKKNPRFKTDNGSGMTNQDSADLVAEFQKLPNFAEFDRLAKDFRAIAERRLDLLVNGGAMDPAQAAAYRKQWSQYVPLKGFEELDENGAPTGTGKGFSTGQRIDKRALGRGSRAGQIVENIVRDYEAALTLVEKVKVGQVARAFVEANPDSKLWEVDHPPLTQVLMPGKVQYHVDYFGSHVATFANLQDARDHVKTLMTAGVTAKDVVIRPQKNQPTVVQKAADYDPEAEIRYLDAGKPVRVQLYDKGLLRAYNTLGRKELDVASKLFNAYNSWMRQVLTQKNPAWFILNAFKDTQSAFMYTTGEQGSVFATKAIGNLNGARRAAWAMYHKQPMGPDWTRVVGLFLKHGGITGFAYVGDIEAKSLQLHGALAKYQTWSEVGSRGMLAIGQKAINNKTFDYIEAYNTTFENMTRLAVFKTALDTGMSPEQAAILAKNVTVNFNRHGEYGPVINAWYLFANANIQGTRNIGHALFFSPHRKQVWALTSGMVAMGVMAGLMGDDDDDLIDDSMRSRSLPTLWGAAKIIIPLAYGWGWFFSFGQLIGQAMKHPEKREKIALKMASSAFDHFGFFGNPLAGDELSLKSAVANTSPTALRPFVQSASNISSFGGPLYPESEFNKTQPGSEKAWRKTRGTAYDQFAKWMNSITGGDEAKAGWASVSPETIKQIVSTLGGGALRLVTDMISLPFEAAKEGEVKAKNIPVVKNFYQAIDADDYRRRFNEQAEKAEESYRVAQAYKKAAGKPGASQSTKDAEKLFKAEEKGWIDAGHMVTGYRKRIAGLRDQESATRADESLTKAARRAKLDALEKEQIDATKQFDAVIRKINRGAP